MPYIPQVRRAIFEPELTNLINKLILINKKGELTYLFYSLIIGYLSQRELRYTTISDAISCLSDTRDEVKRRYLFPYEDKQIIKNGDIQK